MRLLPLLAQSAPCAPGKSIGPRAVCVAAVALFLFAAPAVAIDEEAVNRAIERSKRALLEAITDVAEIEYTTGQGNRPIKVRGRVQTENNTSVVITTIEGKRLVISRRSIARYVKAGHVHPEQNDQFFSGPTSLAVLALLMADVPTTDPTLSLAIEALASDDTQRMGTYVRSLRACVWSALLERPISKPHRVRYGKLLRDDVQWLTRAMKEHGSWDYDAGGRGAGRSDNSNGQFAVMGLFAGALANVEIPQKTWRAIERHWLDTQNPAGGWNYGVDPLPATPSMTVAGCNSLFILLDRLYARADASYVIFEGARPQKAQRELMKRVYDAIERGDEYLMKNAPNIRAHEGYELFGLERLGLASGRARIGGVDWFREYANAAANREWGDSVIGDSYALIFLVHGRAPVLIQKLEHGDASDWNYYHRDLSSLSRYWTRAFERLSRWQRIPANADLIEMQDAPMLYIAGRDKLTLPKSTLDTIRAYVDAGGFVILHADLANRKFTDSATRVFESLFADRGMKFEQLPEDHPIFRCYHGGPDANWKRPIRILGMDDGSRTPVILFPVDIAGAWHQSRDDKLAELFRIMSNVRTYAAPPYNELPSRLRPREIPHRFEKPWAELTVARLAYAGPWDRHRDVWARSAELLRRSAGIDIQAAKPVKEGAAIPARVNVLHIAVPADIKLDDATRNQIKAFVDAGGLVLIDAVDGGANAGLAVRNLLHTLDLGPPELLPRNHEILTGSVRGGQPLNGLISTAAGAGLSSGGAPPPIMGVVRKGILCVIACPFDLTAALSGCYIWNRAGYRNEDTRRIIGNILAWKAGGRSKDTGQ